MPDAETATRNPARMPLIAIDRHGENHHAHSDSAPGAGDAGQRTRKPVLAELLAGVLVSACSLLAVAGLILLVALPLVLAFHGHFPELRAFDWRQFPIVPR